MEPTLPRFKGVKPPLKRSRNLNMPKMGHYTENPDSLRLKLGPQGFEDLRTRLGNLSERPRLVYVVALGDQELLDFVFNDWFRVESSSEEQREKSGINAMIHADRLFHSFERIESQALGDITTTPAEISDPTWVTISSATEIDMLSFCLIKCDFRRVEMLLRCGATYPSGTYREPYIDKFGVVGWTGIIFPQPIVVSPLTSRPFNPNATYLTTILTKTDGDAFRPKISEWCHRTGSDIQQVYARYTTLSMLHRITPRHVYLDAFHTCICFGDFLGAYILFNTFQYQLEHYVDMNRRSTYKLPRDEYQKDSSERLEDLMRLLKGELDLNFSYRGELDDRILLKMANELIEKEIVDREIKVFFSASESRGKGPIYLQKYPRRVDFLDFFYRNIHGFAGEYWTTSESRPEELGTIQDLDCANWIITHSNWDNESIGKAVSTMLVRPRQSVARMLGYAESQGKNEFYKELKSYLGGNNEIMDVMLLMSDTELMSVLPTAAEFMKRKKTSLIYHQSYLLLFRLLQVINRHDLVYDELTYCAAFEIVVHGILGSPRTIAPLPVMEKYEISSSIMLVMDDVSTMDVDIGSRSDPVKNASVLIKCLYVLIQIFFDYSDREDVKYWDITPFMANVIKIMAAGKNHDAVAVRGLFTRILQFEWEDIFEENALIVCYEAVDALKHGGNSISVMQVITPLFDLLRPPDHDEILKRTFALKSLGYLSTWLQVTRNTVLPFPAQPEAGWVLKKAFETCDLDRFTQTVKILINSMPPSDSSARGPFSRFFQTPKQKQTKLNELDKILVDVFMVDKVLDALNRSGRGYTWSNMKPASTWMQFRQMSEYYPMASNILPEWALDDPTSAYEKLMVCFEEFGIKPCDSMFGNVLFCLSILTIDVGKIVKIWRDVTRESTIFEPKSFFWIFLQGLDTVLRGMCISKSNDVRVRRMVGTSPGATPHEFEQAIEKRNRILGALATIYKEVKDESKETSIRRDITEHLLSTAVFEEDFSFAKTLMRDYSVEFSWKTHRATIRIIDTISPGLLNFIESELPELRKRLPELCVWRMSEIIRNQNKAGRDLLLQKGYITPTQLQKYVIDLFMERLVSYTGWAETNMVTLFEVLIKTLLDATSRESEMYEASKLMASEMDEAFIKNPQLKFRLFTDTETATEILKVCETTSGCGPLVWYWNLFLEEYQSEIPVQTLISNQIARLDISLAVYLIGFLRQKAERIILDQWESSPSPYREDWGEKMQLFEGSVYHRLLFVKALVGKNIERAVEHIFRGALLNGREIRTMVYENWGADNTEELEQVSTELTKAWEGEHLTQPLSRLKIERD
jgi:hypothetical protein